MISDIELLSSPVIERRGVVKAVRLPRRRIYLLMSLLIAAFGVHQYAMKGDYADATGWVLGKASSAPVEPARPVVNMGPLVVPEVAGQHHAISMGKSLEDKASVKNEAIDSGVEHAQSLLPATVVLEKSPTDQVAVVATPKAVVPTAAIKPLISAKSVVLAQPVKPVVVTAAAKPVAVAGQQPERDVHDDHATSGCDYLLERGVVTPAEAGLKSMTKDLAQLKNCTVRPGMKLSETETVREINPDLKIVWTNQRVITIVEGGVQK